LGVFFAATTAIQACESGQKPRQIPRAFCPDFNNHIHRPLLKAPRASGAWPGKRTRDTFRPRGLRCRSSFKRATDSALTSDRSASGKTPKSLPFLCKPRQSRAHRACATAAKAVARSESRGPRVIAQGSKIALSSVCPYPCPNWIVILRLVHLVDCADSYQPE